MHVSTKLSRLTIALLFCFGAYVESWRHSLCVERVNMAEEVKHIYSSSLLSAYVKCKVLTWKEEKLMQFLVAIYTVTV